MVGFARTLVVIFAAVPSMRNWVVVPRSGVVVVGVLERGPVVIPHIVCILGLNVVSLRAFIGEVRLVAPKAWFL